MQNRPPGESASPPENVVFLDSSNLQPDLASKPNTVEPVVKQEPFNIDGGTTVKSGGVPPSAWQSNAAELAKWREMRITSHPSYNAIDDDTA